MTGSPREFVSVFQADRMLARRTHRQDIQDPERSKIFCVLKAYSVVLTDIPGSTNTIQNVIILSVNKPTTVPVESRIRPLTGWLIAIMC